MKTTHLLKSVAAAALFVATSLSASAAVSINSTVKDLGAISVSEPTSFNGFSAPGFFGDIFTFTLPANSGSGYSVINFPLAVPGIGNYNTLLANFSLVSDRGEKGLSVDDVILKTVVAVNDQKVGFSFDSTPAGSYYLAVTGFANGSLGGAYSGSISVTPVPEPETFAMLLAGLGVMGAIARRRKI